MPKIFTDGSTGINETNLNKFLALGSGGYPEFGLFTMELRIKWNGTNYQYILFTKNNVQGKETFIGDLGPANVTVFTNVGDANVIRTAAGKYQIQLTGMTNIFVHGFASKMEDSAVIAWAWAHIDPTNINMLNVWFHNSAGAWVDPSTTDLEIHTKIMGVFK